MEPYQIIYADPPWRYDTKRAARCGRKALFHYEPGGHLQAACWKHIRKGQYSLSVGHLSPASGCVAGHLRMGIQVQDGGFPLAEKRTGKRIAGFSAWAFGQEETRRCACWQRGDTRSGNPAKFTNSSFLPLRPTAKSRILSVTKLWSWPGMSPRIELFARQTTPGWDVWGNEVTSSITL